MRLLALLAFLASLAPALKAVAPTATVTATCTVTATITLSPTISRTFTVSPTSTPTPTGTPGRGGYSYTALGANGQPGPLGIRLNYAHNVLNINYTAHDFWTTGEMAFTFPAGFDAPTTSNFTLLPAWDYALFNGGAYSSPSPGTIVVQLQNLTPGQTITFQYGGLASTGFNYAGSDRTVTVQVAVNPFAYTVASVPPDYGVLQTPGPIPIWSPVKTPTVTRTITVTPGYTHTATVTPTRTETPDEVPTMTPVGPDRGIFYSYPNPFDLRRTQLLTFRFERCAWANITIYNLLGEPVARIPQSGIFPGGIVNPIGMYNYAGGGAIWDGRDDLGEMAAGGLYFAVLSTPSGKRTLKFTILH